MKLRIALSMLAGLLLVGASDVLGDNCETIIRSDAFFRLSPLSAGTNLKLTKAGDLVLVGTVREIHQQSTARSLKNWPFKLP